jgi:hypothetical protein
MVNVDYCRRTLRKEEKKGKTKRDNGGREDGINGVEKEDEIREVEIREDGRREDERREEERENVKRQWNGVCAILLRLFTSTERLKRVYKSPGPFLEIFCLR